MAFLFRCQSSNFDQMQFGPMLALFCLIHYNGPTHLCGSTLFFGKEITWKKLLKYMYVGSYMYERLYTCRYDNSKLNCLMFSQVRTILAHDNSINRY